MVHARLARSATVSFFFSGPLGWPARSTLPTSPGTSATADMRIGYQVPPTPGCCNVVPWETLFNALDRSRWEDPGGLPSTLLLLGGQVGTYLVASRLAGLASLGWLGDGGAS